MDENCIKGEQVVIVVCFYSYWWNCSTNNVSIVKIIKSGVALTGKGSFMNRAMATEDRIQL